MDKTMFIYQIAGYVCKYAPDYNILVPSAVIAQAILESGWGESKLAAQYHNYFGLKCGTLWKGKSVNMRTQEEYSAGTLTTITDNFRVYDSMESGVKGYFEFIQLSRYQNLKGITDPQKYLETIRADGYATSYSYVQNCMDLVIQYDLTKYDTVTLKNASETVVIDPGVTADDVIGVYRSWIGLARVNGSHQVILDIYNDFIRKHPAAGRGVLLQPWDPFCAATYSAAHIKLGAVDAIGGVECGVEELVKICQKTGTWEENGAMTPERGWGIVYNWDDDTQPNTGFSDHIGIVESVDGGQITCIEGNMSNGVVGRRQIPVGWGYIRGFIKPKYGQASTKTETVEEDMPVQNKPSKGKSGTPSKEPKWVGRVTADRLNVRTWAGTENPNISSWPVLAQGNLVDVCDTVKAADGSDWYYIRIGGRIFGFVSAAYIS